MRQSTVIFGTLLLAFVVYITLRGQLPSYLSLFTGAAAPTTEPSKGVGVGVKPAPTTPTWKDWVNNVSGQKVF